MSAVILQPNSNTNSSDKYRVVDSEEWAAAINGAKRFYAYTEHTTYEEAQRAQEVQNDHHSNKGN